MHNLKTKIMHNVVLSQIDPEILISSISDLVTANILKAVRNEQTPTDTDELLTVQDTAKVLSLSVHTIYGLISKGELPVMKRSKRLYFSRIELMDYLKLGRKKTLVETAIEAETYLKKKGAIKQ